MDLSFQVIGNSFVIALILGLFLLFSKEKSSIDG
jgi:hypothetical protein